MRNRASRAASRRDQGLMCGICGIVHTDPGRPVEERDLIAMRDRLAHRGPDDAGVYLAGGVGLGSRRLAVLDPSPLGRMPMATADGRFHIVYNGEVYNSPELREELRAAGHSFRSSTDTEVLLHLYARDGADMLPRLNGMFAIAIWDAKDRTLFLARDRLGIKPLYYFDDGRTLGFASEEKALFAHGLSPRFDPECWEELLCFRYVAGASTPFVDVRRLLPGHFLVWKGGETRTTCWWDLAERARARRESGLPSDPVGWYRETFDDAVRLRRLSDVPIGVLLSGGLDSSSVAAALARQAPGVASFTVTFAERAYDEGPLAEEVAERWGLSSHGYRVAPEELFPRFLEASWLNDEPLVHKNEVHLWAISEYAKPLVTVLLSGEGADETLGGYVRYRPLQFPWLLSLVRPFAPALESTLPSGRLRKLCRMLDIPGDDALVLYNACDVLPTDLEAIGFRPSGRYPYRERVLERARGLHPRDPLRRAMFSDQHTFLCSILDRNDRMTMGASIECRVPFLDHRLVEGLAALPRDAVVSRWRSKKLLRDALGHRLPRAVLRHRKWGFGTPWADWFREIAEFRGLVEELADTPPVSEGPFDRRAVRTLVARFLEGDPRPGALVAQLVMMAFWHRACVAGPAEAGAVARRREPVEVRRAAAS